MWVLWSLLSAASSRRSSVSERSDEHVVDEVATKAVISVFSGYAYNGVFANMELGIESIEKLIDNPGTIKESKMKSLRNSIGFLTITAVCNSYIDASSILPIPRHW
ncbi:hypothetical protein L2E82_25315 [Cichorium intybus]|uniref:Uncharacterized protein n=1 Tax=Cichorium intybus TaxID=13427 RepID=A0ACB9E472_CICIN|nr:hypothetical protein L2E82_25315 [Cichorium intybus]